MAETKVTTGQIKPSTINFKDSSITSFSTTSSSWVDITGSTVNYTSGPTAEIVFVIAHFMMKHDTAGSGKIRLMGNSVNGTDEAYTDSAPSAWQYMSVAEWFDWPANTTAAIKLQGVCNGGGTLNVAKGGTGASQGWAPSIRGFAISQ